MNNQAADFDEARWRRLTDADATEERLSDSDRRFIEDFAPRSLEGQAEAQLFAALEGLGDEPRDDDDADASPLVNATVQHVLATRNYEGIAVEPSPASDPSTTRSRSAWMIGGVAAAAAAALLWLGLGGSTDRDPTGDTQPMARAGTVTESAEASPSDGGAPPRADEGSESDIVASPPTVIVHSGRLVPEGGEPLLASAEFRGTARVDSDEGCLALGPTTACFERGARLSVGETLDHITILEGRGTIVAPPQATTALFVEVAGDRYSVDAPVTIETTVHSRSSARVAIVEGQVTLVDADGRAVTLEAGAIRGKLKPTRQVAPPDAKSLLSKARASRSAGDRAAAISAYEKLRRFHPDSPVTKAAMVSLGDLYLDAAKPSDALRCFSRYLQKGGALAQEAHIGRIKALLALGRKKKAQNAIAAFRERYPSSRYADQLGGDSAP